MGEFSKIGDLLDIGEQIKSLIGNLLKTYEEIIGFLDRRRDRGRIKDLKVATEEIKNRLFGRHKLIFEIEDFISDGSPSSVRALRKHLKERIAYLRNFNKEVTPILVHVFPKMAAEIDMITDKSIMIYDKLLERNEIGLALALPKIVPLLKEIANYLESSVKDMEAHLKSL